jgi:putative tryptophan/tyrosine transport system substrate-binding protein
MRRRDLITLLGGAATSSIACSLGVHAQQTALPVVGFLSAIPPNNSFLAAFRRGLAESGYVDGQNVLMNPNFPAAAAELSDVEGAAHALGHELLVLKAATETDIDTAFDAFVGHRPDALVIGADPFFNTRRAQILALASRNSIPTIYVWREFVRVGGLMSYGTDFADNYRKTGAYVGRILRGEKVADLPVQQPTKFELVINLNTARVLGLTVPPTLLAVADEVIE